METKIYLRSILLGLIIGLMPLLAFAQQVDPDNQSTWSSFEPNNFDPSNTMFIIAVITVEGIESMDPDDQIAAFVDGEIRSFVTGLDEEVDPNDLNSTRFYANIPIFSNGNDDGKDIIFRIFDNGNQAVLPVTDTIPFQAQGVIGSLADPQVLNSINIQISFEKDDVLCEADTFAFAKANITGGKEPYFILWESAENPGRRVDGFLTDSVFNLGQGKYYISVTDENEFTKVDSVEIININKDIQEPTIASSPGVEVCEGTDMAFFAFTNETLEPNFYTWFNIFGDTLADQSDILAIPQVANDFTVRAQTTVRNCKSEITDLAIKVNERPDSSISVSTRLAAPNQNIIFRAENPIDGYTYEWNFDDGSTATGPVVSYAYTTIGFFDVTLRVTTPLGCSAMNSVSIRIEESLAASLVPQHVLCDEDTTGSITPIVINGEAPFTFEWSNGATTRSIEDLKAGLYELTVTDALGGRVVVSTEVLSTYATLPAPEVIIDQNGIVCAGERILLSVVDSSFADAQFLWYDEATEGRLDFVGEQLTLFDIQEDQNYFVETKLRACRSERARVSVFVEKPDARFTASRRVVELGEPITFTATNEVEGQIYEYNFDNGVTNNSGPKITYWYPQVGEYTVQLTTTTPTGCVDIQKIVVNVIDDDFFVFLDVQNVKCSDDTTGIITTQVFNGQAPFEYLWNTGETTSSISGKNPGTYSVTVTDANQDQFVVRSQIEAEVDSIPLPEIIIDQNGPVCALDNILVVANTGLQEAAYYWYDRNEQLDFVGNVLEIDDVTEDVELFVETVIDGCASLAATPVNIEVITPDASFTASRRTVELGEPITFTAGTIDPTYSYEYDFDNGDVINTGPIVTYTFPQISTFQVSLKVTTPEGCMDIQSLEVNVVEDNLTVLLDVQNVTCADDTTGIITTQVLNGEEPLTYQWSNGETTSSISGLLPGTYMVTVTDAGGDQVVGTTQLEAEVDAIPLPEIIIDQNGPVCNDDNILIVASTGLQDAQYYWYTEEINGTLAFVGNVLELDDIGEDLNLFVETVIDGCTSPGRSALDVDVIKPDASFSASSTLVELGEPFTFTANNIVDGYQYDWDFGDGNTASGTEVIYTYEAIGPFTVTLTVTTPEGCTDIETLEVNVVMDKLTVLLDVENTACAENSNGAITTQVLFGNPPYQFKWSNGETTSSITGLTTGVFEVTVTDAEGDSTIASTVVEALIDELPAPEVNPRSGSFICFGDNFAVSAYSGIIDAEYYWYTSRNGTRPAFVGDVLQVNNAQIGQQYYVETRLNGCASDERTRSFYSVSRPPAEFNVSAQTVQIGEEQEFTVIDPETYNENYEFMWDFGDGATATGDTVRYTYPAIGSYQVTLITKINGCELEFVRTVEVIEDPTPLTILFEVENILCENDASGIITTQIINGVPPYEYRWSNGAETSALTNLTQGTYSLTVTDANGDVGMSSTTVEAKYADLPAPDVTINLGRPVCLGEDMVLQASSPIVNANYYWYDSPSGGNLLLTGSVVTIPSIKESQTFYVETRIDGCASEERTEASFVVIRPNADFVPSISRVMEGSTISFKADSDKEDRYFWYYGDGDAAENSIRSEVIHRYDMPGLFTVTLRTTLDQCTAETQKQILVDRTSEERLNILFDVQRPLCEDDTTGSVVVQVTNALEPITYEWNNGQSGPVLSNVAPGTYTVAVRDGLGRVESRAVVVEALVAEVNAPQNVIEPTVICPDEAFSVIVGDNILNGDFLWYDQPEGGNLLDAGREITISGITDSLVLFLATRVGNCESVERTEVVLVPNSIEATFLPSSFLSEIDREITFTADTSNASFSYLWDFDNGFQSTAGSEVTYSFPQAGEFQVSLTVTDPFGCSKTTTRTITIINNVLSLDFELLRPACPDDDGGVIIPIVLEGVAPFEYTWSTGQTSEILTNLLPGTYSLTVEDSEGNTTIGTVILDSEVDVVPPADVIVGNGIICQGDDLQLTAAADLPGAEFFWYDGDNPSQLVFVGNIFERSNINEPQSFFVETRYKGCTAATRTFVEIDVEMPDAEFILNSPVIEEGTAIDLAPVNINPGYTYEWTFGDGNSSNSASTSYTYQTAGRYTITLRANTVSGCQAATTRVIEVIEPERPFATTNVTNVNCSDDSNGRISINVFNGEGPFEYQWENGQTGRTRTNLTPGTYSFTVTSRDGFTIVDSATVISSVPTLEAPNVVPGQEEAICVGRSLQVYAYSQQQGVSYYWFDQSEGGEILAIGSPYNLDNLAATTTLYVETRIGECVSSTRTPYEVEVENPNQGFTASPTTAVINQNIQFAANNISESYSYKWEFGDGTVSTLPETEKSFSQEGTYDVSLVTVSENGCVGLEEQNAMINIISPSELTVVLTVKNENCEGDADGRLEANVFNAVGQVSYQWNTGDDTAIIENLSPGVYEVTVTDESGASVVQSEEVITRTPALELPTISVAGGSNAICAGTEASLIALTGQAVDQFNWYDEDNNLIAVGASLTIPAVDENTVISLETSLNGCTSARATLELEAFGPDAEFAASSVEASIGETIEFTAAQSGYASYLWQFGDGQVSSDETTTHAYNQIGNYTVTLMVTDDGGCTATLSKEAFIRINPENNIIIESETTDVMCAADESGVITLQAQGGQPPYAFDWEDGVTGATRSALAAGIYAFTVTDAQGLQLMDSVEIFNMNSTIPTPQVIINGDRAVCLGSAPILAATNEAFPNATYEWYADFNADQMVQQGLTLTLPNLDNDTTIFIQANVNGCQSARIAVDISVQTPNSNFEVTPTSNLMEGDLVQFMPEDMNESNRYYWEFGDNGWSSFSQPYYFYNLPGTFDVMLVVTDEDGCESMEMKEEYIVVDRLSDDPGLVEGGEAPDLTTGQSGYNLPNTIEARAFPNPFKEELTVIFKAEIQGKYRLEMIDLFGQSLWVQHIQAKDGVVVQEIPTEQLNMTSGLYWLQISQGNKRAVLKLSHIE